MPFHHPTLRALGIALGLLCCTASSVHAAALEQQPDRLVQPIIEEGNTAFNTGDYESAISHYQDALTKLLQQQGDDDSKVIALYDRLGESHLWRNEEGDANQAIAYFRKVIAIAKEQEKEVYVPYALQEAAAYMHWGQCHYVEGNYQGALDQYGFAEEILLNGSNNRFHPALLKVKNHMAEAYIRRNREEDHAAAVRLGEEVLAKARENPDTCQAEQAHALYNLGMLCTKQGRYSEGEDYLQQAWDIHERELEDASTHQKRRYITTLRALSIAMERNGDRYGAIGCLRVALGLANGLRPYHPIITDMTRRVDELIHGKPWVRKLVNVSVAMASLIIFRTMYRDREYIISLFFKATAYFSFSPFSP